MATKTLAERTKEAVAATATAPSMVPDLPAPPPKEEEVVPSVKDLIHNKKDLLTLRRLMTEHISLSAVEREAGSKKKKITEQIKKLAGTYQIGKADYDGDRINYYSSERKTIKPDLLLAQGVQPNIILKATETTVSYALKITQAKDEGGE